MTKIEEINNRASHSRIAAQLRKQSEKKAQRGNKLGGCIQKIIVSDRAPSRHPADAGWIEMIPGTKVFGVEVISLDKGVHDNIPEFTYSFSREKPFKGINVHIKTATLGGRSRTWMQLC